MQEILSLFCIVLVGVRNNPDAQDKGQNQPKENENNTFMMQTQLLVKILGQEVGITPRGFSTHAIKVMTETTKNRKVSANS